MKKSKLLAALLLCMTATLPLKAYSADYVFSGTYENVNSPTQNGSVGYINAGESAIVEAGAKFINNQAKSGILYNAGDLTVSGIFDGNSSVHGGAIYNGGSLTVADNTSFANNFANVEGSAIANYGNSVIIGDNVSFKNNSAFLNGYSYSGASEMGALYTEGTLTQERTVTIGNNVLFEGNKSAGGAGLYVFGNNNVTIGTDAQFINNNTQTAIDDTTPVSGGGAITLVSYTPDNGSPRLTLGSGAKFVGNSANYAGAINVNSANAVLNVGENSQFTGNKALGSIGGAIYNRGTSTIYDNVLFEQNSAVAGGALFNDNQLSVTNGIFNENTVSDNGGAVYNRANANITGDFTGNTAASNGGAVYNKSVATVGGNFNNNSAKQGGAIFNAKDLTVKSGSNFENNHSTITGSAISNYADNLVIEDNVSFKNNVSLIEVDDGSMNQMGTIYSEGTATRQNVINIGDNVVFEGNKAGAGAGIYLYGNNNVTIGDNAQFIGNETQKTLNDTSVGGGGGAISLVGGAANGQAKLSLGDNVVFDGNTASYGGAVNVNNENSQFIIGENAQFTDNSATGASGYGGAIYSAGNLEIAQGAVFNGNKSDVFGGAICNMNGTVSEIKNALFEGNSSKYGGAIVSTSELTLSDTSFVNNSADFGGAILAYSDVKINAESKDIVFAGNTAQYGGDIYMNTADTQLTMNAAEGTSISLDGGISGNGYSMLVNPDGDLGSIVVRSAIKNAAIDVQNGTFHLAEGSALDNSRLTMGESTTLNTINGDISSFGSNIVLRDGVNLAVDVNLADGTADNFADVNFEGTDSAGVPLTLSGINPIGNTTANNVTINLAEALGVNPDYLSISEQLQEQTQKVLTPIRYLQGSVSETGLLTMAPTGNGYKDFNPAIMASSVAAQLGGYLTQLNSYDQAFRNMDMYMLMTKKQRQAMKLRNKYAASDGNLVFDPLGTPYDDKAVWFRPYASFENVPLKNGPRVSNVAYGSFFGADSELRDLGHGWDGMFSVYAGYNGSHQAYDGIGIYQNGGTLGLTGVAYKGNFFTGFTLNAGANAGEANTAYGHDNFSMLMAGIANKTGYNIELADGKFIIQPNLQLSYSFVNTFDYRNAAGVKINADPLHAIQVEPGIKFIGNLKNGWQPYAGISVVGNIMDQTNFRANNVSLPELSVKPYVRYGIGVRKTWGEVCTGFLQTYFTNGGRNGVGLQAGFRFTLGKGGFDSLKTSDKLPEMPKTKISLKGVK